MPNRDPVREPHADRSLNGCVIGLVGRRVIPLAAMNARGGRTNKTDINHANRAARLVCPALRRRRFKKISKNPLRAAVCC